MIRWWRRLGEFFLDIIETLVIAMSLFLVVYLFAMQPHQVNGRSMVPNFQSGEYLLTDKVTYKFRNPQRGEVVVFHAPDEANCPKGTGCDFIKRVLALPGETVSVNQGKILINGVPEPETYLPADFETETGNFIKDRIITLSPDEYFVVGDNRPASSDSRAWGPIHQSAMVGKAFFRYWPPSTIGWLPHVSY